MNFTQELSRSQYQAQLQPLTSEVIDSDYVSELFEEIAQLPGNEKVNLANSPDKTIVLGSEPIHESGVAGVTILALLDLPKNVHEHGYLEIGYSEGHGYFVAGPNNDNTELDKQTSETINFRTSPLMLGKADRTSFVFGRDGISALNLEEQDKGYSKVAPILTTDIMPQFGNNTSRIHFEININDSKLSITDHSRFGTELVKHQ